MRKYKIVEVEDGNGKKVYELWWHTPFLFWKDSWRPEATYVGATIYRTNKYNSIEEVKEVIGQYTWEKRVVEEGTT